MKISWVLLSLFLLSPFAFSAIPVPLVYQPLVPATVAPGNADFVLTVNGANFVQGAAVLWNGASRVTTFVSSSQLTANIQAADVATAGTALVQVANSGPARHTSNTVLFPITTPRTNLTFSQHSMFLNETPNVLAAGDFDGDGIADLAVCKDLTGKVSILLGTGGGNFRAPMDYLVSGFCKALIISDFNSDHNLDIAVSNDTLIAVLLGDGSGHFADPVNVKVGKKPEDLVAADLNGDGAMDLAAANFDSGSVSVLLGNNDGTFQPHVDYTVGPGAHGVTVADFDGDGTLDLVVGVQRSNQVSVLRGRGDGTFRAPLTFPAGMNAAYVGTADFNRDGKLDLVVSSLTPITFPVSMLLGNGDGTFQKAIGGPADAFGVPQIADMNGDGKLDVVLFNGSGPVVLAGKGNGRFQAPKDFSTGTANGVTIWDFNNDGLLDLAVGGYSSGNVVILLQTSAGN